MDVAKDGLVPVANRSDAILGSSLSNFKGDELAR